MNPETSAELAQIHFILEKSLDWNGPLKDSTNKIKHGEIAEALAALNSHMATVDHLAGRLRECLAECAESEAA